MLDRKRLLGHMALELGCEQVQGCDWEWGRTCCCCGQVNREKGRWRIYHTHKRHALHGSLHSHDNLILRTLSGHQVAEIKKQAGACHAGVNGNFWSEHGDQRLKGMGSRRGYLNVKRYI